VSVCPAANQKGEKVLKYPNPVIHVGPHFAQKPDAIQRGQAEMNTMRARGMIGICAILVMVTVNSVHAADVRINVGDIEDKRSTGRYSSNLDVELKFLGDDIEGVKGFRCTVTKAVDDTGRDLVKEEKKTKEFSDFNADNPARTKVSVKLNNPSRKAATVKEISGEIEMFMPDNDPASIVTITNPKITLSHPSLTAAQIKISILSKEQMNKEMGEAFVDGIVSGESLDSDENKVKAYIKDPQSKLVKIEFLGSSGKVIRPKWTTTFNNVRSYYFSESLPKGMPIRVYVATPKSLIKVPFMFRDLALP